MYPFWTLKAMNTGFLNVLKNITKAVVFLGMNIIKTHKTRTALDNSVEWLTMITSGSREGNVPSRRSHKTNFHIQMSILNRNVRLLWCLKCYRVKTVVETWRIVRVESFCVQTVTWLTHGIRHAMKLRYQIINLCQYVFHCCIGCIKDCIFAFCESVFEPFTLCPMVWYHCLYPLVNNMGCFVVQYLRQTCEGLALVSCQLARVYPLYTLYSRFRVNKVQRI